MSIGNLLQNCAVISLLLATQWSDAANAGSVSSGGTPTGSDATQIASASLCAIPFTESSAWTRDLFWAASMSHFTDRAAVWLSPTPLMTPGNFCGPLPQGKKAVFVSTITVTWGGQFFVQLIADNASTLRILGNLTSGHELFKLAVDETYGNYRSSVVNLVPGTYFVVADLQDTLYQRGAAIGLLASVMTSPANTVLTHTSNDGTWSAYVVDDALDPVDFVKTLQIQ